MSTDGDDIAQCALAAGAEVPHRRPSYLAHDLSPTAEVIQWEIEQMLLRGQEADHVCTVYPAAALLDGRHLLESFNYFVNGQFDAVFAAIRHPAPIWRAFKVSDEGLATMIWPENRLVRSQDLPPTFFDAGQFYWSTTSYWRDQLDPELAAQARVGLWELRPFEVVDIDTEDDWILAEKLFAVRSPNR